MEQKDTPVRFFHRISGKILLIFTLVILVVLLVGGFSILLSRNTYLRMLAVQEESKNTRVIDELRTVLHGFLFSQLLEIPPARREAALERTRRAFLTTLETYMQQERVQETPESQQEIAFLLQVQTHVVQHLLPLARTALHQLQEGHGVDTSLLTRLREAVTRGETLLEEVVAVHHRLVDHAIAAAEREQRLILRLYLLFLCLGVLVVLSVHFFFYRVIVSPIQQLNSAILRIAEGGFKERVAIRGKNEFAQLASSFNTMATRLEAHEQMIRSFQQGLETKVRERTRALEAANQELRRMQMRLLETERLATIGEIAANVAHEIRTPLNSLAINFQMIRRTLKKEISALAPRLEENLRLLGYEIERINTVITSFIKLAKAPKSSRHPIALGKVITDMVQLLEGEAAHTHVTLHYTSSSLLPPLVADENQIRQMLINLLLNAIQAQPDGGAVFISTHYDPQRQIIHLVVQDKGPGIAQEQISEIWKPFFTTKETGTGLGLAIVHRIVQDHRGTITCVSEPGKGACFQVSLPVESS